jgi:peptide/nickel transport system substrate-binding protein
VRCGWLLFGLAGCGPCTPAPERPFTLGTLFEPTTLDPAFASGAGERELVELLYRDLTVRDDRGELIPMLAEALPRVGTTTGGASIVTWRLRAGLAWSDGKRITADDLVFAHRIEADDRLAAINHEVAKKVRRIYVHDPHSFYVLWKQPFLDAVEPRVHAILPAHAYPKPEGTFAGMVRGEVSSGPYRVVEWVAGQHLIAERNPHWFGPKPELDRIVFRFFKAEDGLVAALEAKEIDALGEASGLGLDAADLLKERLKDTHTVEFKDSGSWLHLVVRLDDPVVGDIRVRRAITKAIDRDALSRVLYGGHASPSYGVFGPRHPGHVGANALGFDREAATRLIEEAGVKQKSIELMYSGGPAGAKAAEFIADALSKIGLEVKPVGVHFRVLSDRLREHAQAPLTLYVWRTLPTWDGRSLLHSRGAQNYSGLAEPDLDARLDVAEKLTDREEWGRNLLQVNLHFQELLPAIPLLFKEGASVRPKWLEGWAPTGARTPVTWNAERWRKTHL